TRTGSIRTGTKVILTIGPSTTTPGSPFTTSRRRQSNSLPELGCRNASAHRQLGGCDFLRLADWRERRGRSSPLADASSRWPVLGLVRQLQVRYRYDHDYLE